MKRQKKFLITTSLLGISVIAAIPIFSFVSPKNNTSILSTSTREEVTEENVEGGEEVVTPPTIDNNYPLSPLEPVNDKENGITYRPFTYDGVPGYQVSNVIPNRTSYVLKAYPNPNCPDVPLISIDNAFSGNNTISEMPQIPETVLTMGYAFTNCTSLTTFTKIPDICKNINYAFSGCSALTSTNTITIPRSIKTGVSAFRGCNALTCNIDFQFAVTDLNRKGNVSGMFSNVNNIGEFIFTDPYTSINLKTEELGFVTRPTVKTNFNTTYTMITKDQMPSLYTKRYVCDVYDSNNANQGNQNLKKFFTSNTVVSDGLPINLGNGATAITKPTKITFKDIRPSLKNGTITLKYDLENYFQDNVYHEEVKTVEQDIVLEGFRKVTGETSISQIPGMDLSLVLPSAINKSNWTSYFQVNNAPIGATVEFISAEAIDYIPGASESSVPSSRLTMEIRINRYFQINGDDFELVTTDKTFTVVNNDMKFTEPTRWKIKNVDSTLNVYPNQYSEKQIKDSVQFTNLPQNASTKVVVTNRNTMDSDGYIAIKAWASKYYNNEGKLISDENYYQVDPEREATWTNPLVEGRIEGFKTIAGVTTVSVKQDAFALCYPQFLSKKLTLDTVNDFFTISNLPDGGRLTGLQVNNWVNTAGIAQVNLTFSKYAKNINSHLQIVENYTETINVSNMKTLTGVTKIVLDDADLNKRMYPSQVSPTFVQDSRIIKIINPAPAELGSSTLQIANPTPSDRSGQITFTVTCTNLIVNSEDKKDVIFTNTNMVQTFSVGGFYQSPGPTTIVPVDLKDQDIPDSIEPEEFSKYFYIQNLPMRDAQSGLDSKQYEVNQISPNVNNKTVQATVTLYQYFNEQGNYVDIRNGGLPKTVTLTNVSFNRDSIIENNWANGTNWLWLIIGIAGFILLLLFIVIIILAIFKSKRDRQDYNIKKMVVNNEFSHNALPSSTPLLGPSSIAPSQTVLTYARPVNPKVPPKQQVKVTKTPNGQVTRTVPTRTAPPGGPVQRPVKK